MQDNLLANSQEKYCGYLSNPTMRKPLSYRRLPKDFFEWPNLLEINYFRHGFSAYLKQSYQMFSASLINVNSGCSDNNIHKAP